MECFSFCLLGDEMRGHERAQEDTKKKTQKKKTQKKKTQKTRDNETTLGRTEKIEDYESQPETTIAKAFQQSI